MHPAQIEDQYLALVLQARNLLLGGDRFRRQFSVKGTRGIRELVRKPLDGVKVARSERKKPTRALALAAKTT